MKIYNTERSYTEIQFLKILLKNLRILELNFWVIYTGNDGNDSKDLNLAIS